MLNLNKKVTVFGVALIALTLIGGGYQLVQAWRGPSTTAPGGNVVGPITTGTVQQHKQGNLTLGKDLGVGNNLSVGGDVNINGNLNINKSNCRLSTDSAGNVVCDTSGSFTRSGPYNCNINQRSGNPLSRTCTISNSSDKTCFLTAVYGVDSDDIDGFACTLTKGGGDWQITAYGDDYDDVNCAAMCIK